MRETILKHGFDILNNPKMQLEKNFIQHGNITTYEHSLFVAYLSLSIVKKLKIKVNEASLVRGALLHDFYLYDWHDKNKPVKGHGFKHAKISLTEAKKEFKLNQIEEDIILKHMFPLNINLPKYKESYIVTLADKIAATIEIFCEFPKIIVNTIEKKLVA